jgi:RNA recognition motif-containing protein
MSVGLLIHRASSLETVGHSAKVLERLAQKGPTAAAGAKRDVAEQGDAAISNKVFVGNLSFDVTREELVEAFGAVGRVVDAKVPTDRETGRPRGFAFVEFESDEVVQRCIEQMNGRDLKGRSIRVNAAEDRPRAPGGGPGAGGFSRPGGGFARPGPGGGGGFSRPGGGFSRPGGGFRSGGPPSFPPPEESGDTRGRRFRQKPEAKPARTTSPRRRRDDIVDDDDADY